MYSYASSLVAWLLSTVFTEALVGAVYHSYGHDSRAQITLASDDAGWPAPEDGTVQRCVGSYDWSVYVINPSGSFFPYGADTSFDLPVDSDILYFLTRGGGNIGSVTIVNSDDVKDTVDIFVYARYHTQEALDHVNVCLLAKENGEGVGIYTPDDYVPSDEEGSMHFDVTVTLPASSNDELLRIKDFESNSSHYSFTIKDIQKLVYFDKFTLHADTAGIRSDSIFAGIGTFTSTRAFIRGAFNVSSSLELTTTSADIKAQVGLRNDVPSYLTGVPLRINDNPKQSIISDYATSGNFKVSASTSNGPITLSYTNSPVDSIQNLVVTTSGSPVSVSLDSAYEGDYTLETTGSNPITVSKSGATDPSGEGRARILTQESQGTTYVEGTVYWDPSGPGASQSDVQIQTSGAPITLTV